MAADVQGHALAEEVDVNTLIRWATGRNIFILLLLFLLANLVVIPAIYPKFQTLDTLTSYTPDQAYKLITSYGDAGRQLYVVIELTLDLIYPFMTALLFSLVILYTFQKAFPGHAWLHKLALLPFAVMLADYVENACVVIMLLSYPRTVTRVAAISNIATIMKFGLTPLELIFLIGLIGWLIQAVRHRRPLAPAR